MPEKPCKNCRDQAATVRELAERVEDLETLVNAMLKAPAVHAYGSLARADVQAARRRRAATQQELGHPAPTKIG